MKLKALDQNFDEFKITEKDVKLLIKRSGTKNFRLTHLVSCDLEVTAVWQANIDFAKHQSI